MRVTNENNIHKTCTYTAPKQNHHCIGGGGSLKFDFYPKSGGAQITPSNINLQAYYLPKIGLNFTANSRIHRGLFPLTEYSDSIPCPCCGEKMKQYDKNKVKELSEKISQSTGLNLAYVIYGNINEFQPLKRELALEIMNAAADNPHKNISELLEIISEKHTLALRAKQISVVDEIVNEANINTLSKSKRKAVRRWQKEQTYRISEADREGDFKNKYLVRSFANLAKRKHIDFDKEKIEYYFDKLPNSKSDVDAFVTKYKRRPPSETVHKMIKNTEPTIEHIMLFSKTGDNTYGNLLIMCEDCNGIRGKLNYDDLLKIYPEMKENIKKYFAKIQEILDNPKTPDKTKESCKTYINDAKTTLKNCMNYNTLG